MTISVAQRARLGVFVIAGSVLIAVFIAVSLGLKYTQTTKAYIAYFTGESLSGLEVGALVKYTGVPIGKVSKISYQPEDLSRVKVTLSINSDFPMKEGMYATTGFMGITGLKYVEILGGESEAPPLMAGSVIPTKVSPLSSISGKAETIIAKVELLLNHLNELSNPDSLETMRLLLDNLAAITTDTRVLTASVTPKIDTLTGSATSLLRRMDGIAGDVKSLTGSLDTTLSGNRLASTIGMLDSTVISLKELTENLTLTVKQTREDFSVTMQNMRQATESASELARMLTENPSLLLKGETQRERKVR